MTALYATAGRMAAGGGDPAGIVALDYAADTVGFAVFPAIAIAMTATSLAQVISRQFPRWLGWPGMVVGVFGIASSTYLSAMAQNVVGGSSPLGSWMLGFWIWMLATGVVLFRRTPSRNSSQPESL
jgi:uncharacterized membrane protein